MRIVHLNTDDSRGGAARAAIRLHRGLLERGDDSTFLVRQQTGLHSDVPGILRASDQADPAYAELIQKWYVDHRRTEVSPTIFSGGLAGVSVAAHPAIARADVLNLHWVPGFLMPDHIGQLLDLNKPVVWTLHDQWPMTGGCHYTAGCQQFTHICQECPQLAADEAGLVPAAFADRSECYEARITAIAPSAWMARQARTSSIFHEARIETIANSVDHDVFRPASKLEVRRKLDIPVDAFVMLFACSAAFEKRKGIPLFRALLKELGGSEVFSLFVGWQTAEGEPAPGQKHFGFINEDSTLRDVYNAADVLLHLASEDNLPNMPLEAMACGTPVLGIKNGGLPEIVEHEVSGLLVPSGDFAGLIAAARSLMHDRHRCVAFGAAARKVVEQKFTRTLQAGRYAALYGELTADSRPRLRNHHVQGRMRDLIAISAELRLAAEIQKAEQRVRDEIAPTVTRLKQEKQKLEEENRALEVLRARLERRVRKIERNVGYRVVSGLTDGVRNAGRALRGKDSGTSG